MIQQEKPQQDQERDFIDVADETEPDYGAMAFDVVQINSVEFLRAEGGKPQNLHLRSGISFFHATVDIGSPVSFLNKRTADILMMKLSYVKFMDVLRHPVVTTYCEYIKGLSNCLVLLKSRLRSRDRRLTEFSFLCRRIGRETCWVGLNFHGQLDIETIQRKPLEVSTLMGTLNHLQRFITLNHLQGFITLQRFTVSFRSSLKKCNKKSFMWVEEQNVAFTNIQIS